MHLNVPSLPHIHCQVDFDWRFFPFFEFMASRMTTSYEPQTTQMNEELPQNSSLNLTLTQHPRDENPKPWEVRPCLEVEPPQTWYYCIYLNSCTLVILLQVDLVSGDEPETIYKSFYKIENTSIFTWSSIFSIRHYCWLHGLIRQLPPNSKADYLVHTIRHILNFL
jgi:hypothetical protein